jgi:hypothetical protein
MIAPPASCLAVEVHVVGPVSADLIHTAGAAGGLSSIPIFSAKNFAGLPSVTVESLYDAIGV